jgi:predicted nucleic acid-binding protein
MEPAALAHELTLATRNVNDFKDANVPLLDPWTAN